MKAQSAHGRAPSLCRLNVAPSGFSLVELVVVVAAISILALIAVPRFGHARARYQLEGAGKRLIADLAVASATARAASMSKTISFNTSTATYTITGSLSLDRATPDTVVALKADPYNVSLSVANFGGAASVTFDGYGRASSTGKILLRRGDERRVVELTANSAPASMRQPNSGEFTQLELDR